MGSTGGGVGVFKPLVASLNVPVHETVTFQPGQTPLLTSVPIVPSVANLGIVQVAITTRPLVTDGSAETGYFAIVTGVNVGTLRPVAIITSTRCRGPMR
jgi:hypothetical protein